MDLAYESPRAQAARHISEAAMFKTVLFPFVTLEAHLQVQRRVPVAVKEHEVIGADEVKPRAACSRRQQAHLCEEIVSIEKLKLASR